MNPRLTREQLHQVALYGLCPDCRSPRQAVMERVDDEWRYRLACDCNPPRTPEPKESE